MRRSVDQGLILSLEETPDFNNSRALDALLEYQLRVEQTRTSSKVTLLLTASRIWISAFCNRTSVSGTITIECRSATTALTHKRMSKYLTAATLLNKLFYAG